MTDAEKLAEGLLIFLKRPGPTPDDFARWETILGAHHMHIRVLTDLARKILNDREQTTPEPNTAGPVPPNGALIPGITTTWEASRPPLHDNSPAEGTLRPLEPGGYLERDDRRGGHGGTISDGSQAQLPNFGY